jgi:BirA family biotin operon repressor/biotin-[acetyl-CoA-carboxylase] ligase
VNDTVTPERVVPLLRGRLGTPYIYAARCESTQRLLTDAEPHGAVAACDEQTAGRGRLGRPWQTPAGTALLCSILLRRPPGRNPAELSVVSALATAETIEHVTSVDACIKWPNDVLLGGRKVAGILLEGRPGTIVLGIGLNINQTEAQLPDRPQFPAGSLFTSDGNRRERAPILAELLVRLELLYERWAEEGLAALLPEVAGRDALHGTEIEIGALRGRAAGIAEGGELVLETAEGRCLVSTGEVTLIGPRWTA